MSPLSGDAALGPKVLSGVLTRTSVINKAQLVASILRNEFSCWGHLKDGRSGEGRSLIKLSILCVLSSSGAEVKLQVSFLPLGGDNDSEERSGEMLWWRDIVLGDVELPPGLLPRPARPLAPMPRVRVSAD